MRNVGGWEGEGAWAEALPGLVRPGDLVLVKGSRSVHLEDVTARLSVGWKES